MGATTPTKSVRILIGALEQAGEVLDQVTPESLSRATPCEDWDVATLSDHLVATPGRFLAQMQGEKVEWSAQAPHVENDWGARFRSEGDELVRAWQALDKGDEESVSTDWQVAEIAVHTWDLATALDLSIDDLDPEVAEAGSAFMRASLKPEMRAQAFGPEQPAPEEAGPYAALAAFAGRSSS